MTSKTTTIDKPVSGQKLALVIGIWDYQNEGVRKLTNPENDAKDITLVLERIGFSVTTNLNLAYWDMAKACDEFRKKIQPGDMVLFYFAGHGKQWNAMDAKVGSLIAFACAPGTIASDGENERNGLFTKYLLKHLETPNEDIRMILADVTKEVMIKSNMKQLPFLSAALTQKNIYLCGQPQSK
ncbi:unnamed protein product [Rotaria sp. Silwood2]|nr:unnamed protein product [Rotaria sp. Silwood2]CAF3373946.1 unnamed protein product [Rotaria sp. Silwood2]CAF4528203.1 unnamed protein product [Rotaria sp. Silwood2]CAF4541757.1 unnamed protein product [Rotaria sp. Silwood2]